MKFKCLIVVLALAYGCNSNNERVTQKLDNGDIMVTERIDGKMIQKVYASNNVLRSELNVVDSTLTGTLTAFFSNGKVFQEYGVKNGTVHGFHKTYDGSGALIREYNYVEGRKEGVGKAYYPNGKLRAEASYSHGRPTDVVVEYDESGKVMPKPKIIVVKSKATQSKKALYSITLSSLVKENQAYAAFPTSNDEKDFVTVKMVGGVGLYELEKYQSNSMYGEISIYVEYTALSGLQGIVRTTILK